MFENLHKSANPSLGRCSNVLLVENLSNFTDENTLYDMFIPYGSVEYAKIIRESPYQRNDIVQESLIVGLVKYYEVRDAEIALSALDGERFLGKAIRVTWASPQLVLNATEILRANNNSSVSHSLFESGSQRNEFIGEMSANNSRNIGSSYHRNFDQHKQIQRQVQNQYIQQQYQQLNQIQQYQQSLQQQQTSRERQMQMVMNQPTTSAMNHQQSINNNYRYRPAVSQNNTNNSGNTSYLLPWMTEENLRRAVQLAMEDPSRNIGNIKSTQVIISFKSSQINLPITPQLIWNLFSSFGCLIDVQIKKHNVDEILGAQDGYGFIHYELSWPGIYSALKASNIFQKRAISSVFFDCNISHQLDHLLKTIQKSFQFNIRNLAAWSNEDAAVNDNSNYTSNTNTTSNSANTSSKYDERTPHASMTQKLTMNSLLVNSTSLNSVKPNERFSVNEELPDVPNATSGSSNNLSEGYTNSANLFIKQYSGSTTLSGDSHSYSQSPALVATPAVYLNGTTTSSSLLASLHTGNNNSNNECNSSVASSIKNYNKNNNAESFLIQRSRSNDDDTNTTKEKDHVNSLNSSEEAMNALISVQGNQESTAPFNNPISSELSDAHRWKDGLLNTSPVDKNSMNMTSEIDSLRAIFASSRLTNSSVSNNASERNAFFNSDSFVGKERMLSSSLTGESLHFHEEGNFLGQTLSQNDGYSPSNFNNQQQPDWNAIKQSRSIQSNHSVSMSLPLNTNMAYIQSSNNSNMLSNIHNFYRSQASQQQNRNISSAASSYPPQARMNNDFMGHQMHQVGYHKHSMASHQFQQTQDANRYPMNWSHANLSHHTNVTNDNFIYDTSSNRRNSNFGEYDYSLNRNSNISRGLN